MSWSDHNPGDKMYHAQTGTEPGVVILNCSHKYAKEHFIGIQLS